MKVLEGDAVLGFRAHSGWAAMVAVGGSVNAPLVIQRQRLELVDRSVSGAMQPYHAAKEMRLKDAEAFLQSCAGNAKAMATAAVRDSVAELAAKGYRVLGACVLAGSGRVPASLAATLASHPLIHTAEGEFFRRALKQACEDCGLEVLAIKEKELFQLVAARSHLTVDALKRRVSELGKSIGPPWRQDEKFCTVAAWAHVISPPTSS
jgi:hypothetical protein